MVELWWMRSTSSLPLLPGPLWSGMVPPDRALSMGRIEQTAYLCKVTPLSPPPYVNLLEPFHFFTAGDQLVVPRGVTHISCHYKNTIEGAGENRTNEQTRTMLWVNPEQKESMQHYISDSIYGLMLAWITSENSTKQLECRHLDSVFFAGPYLMLARLSARVSGVDCPCPWFHANSSELLCPTNSLLASRYHFRIPRDFRSKNSLSGFAPKQRNCLLGGPPI